MENRKISEYLKKVVEKSNDKTSMQFNFSSFDRVNIYLIRQVLNKWNHLWLKPCNNNITKFYQSMIFSVAIDFFEKNYRDGENPRPNIGDRYQKKNKRYEVIDIGFKDEGVENPIKLKYINKNKDVILTTSITTLVNDYEKLDNRAGSSNRDTFKPMLDFVEKTLGVRKNIPAFPHKFAVVAQKTHFESCFSQLDKKAFPYTYIADNGEETKNLPVSEPMFFVVSNYETIQKYIFDKSISLETIIFMGNKYDHQLQEDVNRGRFQKGIFIGEKKPDIQQLLQWHWTLLEYQDFEGLESGQLVSSQIETVKVTNETLEAKTTQFIEHIKRLEADNYIDLKRLYPYVSYIYPFVVLSDNSRLKNRIDDLSKSFQRKLERVLGEAFSSIGADCKEVNQQLVAYYQIILEQLYFQNNAKTQALQQMKETDYLLMPERQTLHVWQTEIKDINWRKTKVISFSKFKQLEKPRSVTVLSLTDYDFYCAIRNSQHRVKWLLYDYEYKRYQNFSTQYDNKLIEEYKSNDRKKLIGIDYPDEIQSETIDEIMDRIFDAELDRNEYATRYQDHIDKKITFTNDESIELSANSVVILIDQHNKLIKYKITDLIVDDKIRIYENKHKEVLFDAISKSDTQGKFQKILSDSKLWKNLIRQSTDQGTDDEKIAEIANKCDVDKHTVKGWLSDNSNTKFPQNIESLQDILDNDYQQIRKSKKEYNSIMIALGRDLSDEISDYIITNVKGKLLAQFDEDSIKAISEHNMPVRTIKNIEII